VDVSVDRLAAGVEATAYFVVSEALTNAVKHLVPLAPQLRRELRMESYGSRCATTVSVARAPTTQQD
jgi:hypothetical protein